MSTFSSLHDLSSMNFVTASAFFRLGRLTSEDLVSYGVANLDRVAEAKSFSLLAGYSNHVMAEVGPLFRFGLSEAGISETDVETAPAPPALPSGSARDRSKDSPFLRFTGCLERKSY